MGKKLIIKGADFSQNAVEIKEVELPLITSAENERSVYKVSEEYLILEKKELQGVTWYSYIVDVSQLVGSVIKIYYANGYSNEFIGYGGFLESIASRYLINGFDSISNYDEVGIPISAVASVSSEESNKYINKEYIVPEGAQYLMFSCKTSVLQEGERARVTHLTY